jgi:hypothetical protein
VPERFFELRPDSLETLANAHRTAGRGALGVIGHPMRLDVEEKV